MSVPVLSVFFVFLKCVLPVLSVLIGDLTDDLAGVACGVGKKVLAEEDSVTVVKVNGGREDQVIRGAAEALLKLLERLPVVPEFRFVKLFLRLMNVIPGVVQDLERTVKTAPRSFFSIRIRNS